MPMSGLKQPAAGIVATALIMVASLGLISLFTFEVFSGWVAFGLMCVIPMQVGAVVLWKGEHPEAVVSRRQPLRGLLLILITAVAGVIAGLVYFLTVGGGLPPSPMLIHCTVVSVVVMFWFAVMWGGWPFNAVIRNPVTAVLVTVAESYAVNVLLFRVFFNYDFMKDAPVYVASLDPHGLFNAWSVLVFYVTCLSVMFLMLHFDLWPLTKYPKLVKQPVLGLLWTVLVLILGAALFIVGTRVFQMDVVAFLVSVPIPFIFGTIVVLNMLQNSLFGSLPQPMKGVANTIAAAAAGSLLAVLYRALAGFVTGSLGSGPPAYESEIWLASALLSVTFPFLIFHAEFLGFWPLKGK
jgi:hypothetical protein